jgi:hypothetical protein
VQRIGLDLRHALDRATYGNIYALAVETGHYLKQVLTLLDAPDIKKAFDANTKWNAVEIVSQRYLGGMAENLAAREDGRKRPPHPTIHCRPGFQDRDRPAVVPIRGAADGSACRSLARRLSHDPRGARLSRGDAGIAAVCSVGTALPCGKWSWSDRPGTEVTVITPFPDLSVHIARRRRRCVLDPNLALSRHGTILARLLAPYAELWVGPEHFTVLDNALLYQQEPELLVWPETDKPAIAEVPEVLRDWTRLRDEAGQCLHWLGDAWRESCVPEDIHETVHPRCEAASRTLDLCLPKTIEATGPLIPAMRDTAALCAVLPARILGRGIQGELPLICRHLQQWGLACKKLPP